MPPPGVMEDESSVDELFVSEEEKKKEDVSVWAVRYCYQLCSYSS